MSKEFEDRFIIDCYGIIDTATPLKGDCENDRLSWDELCKTLNRLYISADLDNEALMLEIRRLEEENKVLRERLEDIYMISKKECEKND